MTTTEDFTFPTTTDPPLCFIGSPPLWHRTSSKYAPKEDGGGESFSREKSEKGKQQRKSFSYYVERGCDDDGEDEKMDMLWEDFNEELSKIQGPGMQLSNLSPGRDAECRRLGAVVSGKKPPSVLVLVKVLKKVFLLHNSHRTVKKCSR